MNGYRVLVVEDDAASCAALLRILDNRGWIVTVAQTVAEAMASLDPPPHCILLDLMLPDGGGEDVLRKVRDEELPTKVAVVTGTGDPVRLALVKGMDPDALFQKPLDFHAICRAVETDTAEIETMPWPGEGDRAP
jgi:DNA-binding response OmpR family regulator